MKVKQSTPISAFGGLNFVFEYLNTLKIDQLLEKHLPPLASQSNYTWRDIFYSFMSIYYCGGDCVEDLAIHLRNHLANNPFLEVPSPDTMLRRIGGLCEEKQYIKTPRGTASHAYCRNAIMENLMIRLLKQTGAFKATQNILDYDNTIIFNEKLDSKMTYKKQPGYQPGVCLLNENHVLYVENRGGNSDAKSFQSETLNHLFNLLKENGIPRMDYFRADAASYQYEVVSLLVEKVKHFFVGCRNSYVEKYFTQIKDWQTVQEGTFSFEVGEISIVPFVNQAEKAGKKPQTFRLIVKRTPTPDGQLNLFTQDAFSYRGILTNCNDKTAIECAQFYYRRGIAEQQFDILKNDFGWNNLPFSAMEKNQVFLCFSAICRNLYNSIIVYFSERVPVLKPHYRLKKFTFRFIVMPAKWIRQARNNILRVFATNLYPT